MHLYGHVLYSEVSSFILVAQSHTHAFQYALQQTHLKIVTYHVIVT